MSGLSADGYFGPIGSKSDDVMSGLGDLFKFRQCIHLPLPAPSVQIVPITWRLWLS